MGRVKIKRIMRIKNPKIGDVGRLSNFGNVVFEVKNVDKNYIYLQEKSESDLKINLFVEKNKLIKDDNGN